MEGVCVCVSVGKVVVREDHSEPTSCRMPKYAKFKLLPPSSLLWTLTVAHLWTLTIEHFSESYVCIVFIHLFFLTFFPFLFDHFQQHTSVLFWLPPVYTLYKNPHWKTFLHLPSAMTLFHSLLNLFQSGYLALAPHPTETAVFKSLANSTFTSQCLLYSTFQQNFWISINTFSL